MQASRNGYFFTLDRLTREHLVTSKFSDTVNWAKPIKHLGTPVSNAPETYLLDGH